MTFDIIALVCALGQSPVECQAPTAREVMVLGNVPTELRCLLESQQHMAQVAGLIKPDEYAKFSCVRHPDESL